MAGKARDVLVRFLVDDKQKSKLKGIGDEAGKTQSKFSKLSGGAKAVVGGFAALGATAVVGFLKDVTEAAIEDAAAQVQLKVALQNTVGATDEQVASVEEYIDTTARATGVTDNELRPAFANLVRASGDVTAAQDLMGTAMDIATARGLPLEAVTLGIAKAAQGNVGAMGRMGLKVRDTEGKFLTFEEAITEANETMGGAMDAAASSAEGRLKRVAVAVDEAKESVGNFVVLGLGKLLQGFEIVGTVGDGVEGMIKRLEITTGAASDTAAAFLTVWKQGGVTFEEVAAAMNLTAEEALKLRDADDEFLKSLGLTIGNIEFLRDLMEDEMVKAAQTARDKGIHPLREEIEETEDATRDLIDAQRALVDPLFALHDATNKAREAEIKYNDAVNEHGRLSREAVDAGLDLADAQMDLNAASNTYAEEGGEASIEALRDALEAAGLMPDAIQAIIDKFGQYNTAANGITKIEFTKGGRPKIDPVKGQFAEGGVVGGPKGSPQLVLAHGGETILPTHKTNGTVVPAADLGGSVTLVNRGIIASPREFESWFVRAYDNAKRHGRL